MKAITASYGCRVARTSLGNLDLNLLTALDALLTERNVTRAAGRLGVTQPAASAALARLRRHFDDELLSRAGNRYELTALATLLRPEVTMALGSVRRVFEAQPVFSPGESDREFSLVMSDYAAAVMGEGLSRVLAAEAPHAGLRIQQPTPYLVDHVVTTIRAVDGIVLPHGFIADMPHADLFTDDWVGVADPGHPVLAAEVTLESLAGLPWVLSYDTPTAFTPAQQHLRLLGIEVSATVVVDTFTAIPFFVTGTRRIAMLQRRLVERLAGTVGLATFPLPFAPVPLRESFWWHPTRRSDPAHQWLRGVLRSLADAL